MLNELRPSGSVRNIGEGPVAFSGVSDSSADLPLSSPRQQAGRGAIAPRLPETTQIRGLKVQRIQRSLKKEMADILLIQGGTAFSKKFLKVIISTAWTKSLKEFEKRKRTVSHQ